MGLNALPNHILRILFLLAIIAIIVIFYFWSVENKDTTNRPVQINALIKIKFGTLKDNGNPIVIGLYGIYGKDIVDTFIKKIKEKRYENSFITEITDSYIISGGKFNEALELIPPNTIDLKKPSMFINRPSKGTLGFVWDKKENKMLDHLIIQATSSPIIDSRYEIVIFGRIIEGMGELLGNTPESHILERMNYNDLIETTIKKESMMDRYISNISLLRREANTDPSSDTTNIDWKKIGEDYKTVVKNKEYITQLSNVRPEKGITSASYDAIVNFLDFLEGKSDSNKDTFSDKIKFTTEAVDFIKKETDKMTNNNAIIMSEASKAQFAYDTEKANGAKTGASTASVGLIIDTIKAKALEMQKESDGIKIGILSIEAGVNAVKEAFEELKTKMTLVVNDITAIKKIITDYSNSISTSTNTSLKESVKTILKNWDNLETRVKEMTTNIASGYDTVVSNKKSVSDYKKTSESTKANIDASYNTITQVSLDMKKVIEATIANEAAIAASKSISSNALIKFLDTSGMDLSDAINSIKTIQSEVNELYNTTVVDNKLKLLDPTTLMNAFKTKKDIYQTMIKKITDISNGLTTDSKSYPALYKIVDESVTIPSFIDSSKNNEVFTKIKTLGSDLTFFENKAKKEVDNLIDKMDKQIDTISKKRNEIQGILNTKYIFFKGIADYQQFVTPFIIDSASPYDDIVNGNLVNNWFCKNRTYTFAILMTIIGMISVSYLGFKGYNGRSIFSGFGLVIRKKIDSWLDYGETPYFTPYKLVLNHANELVKKYYTREETQNQFIESGTLLPYNLDKYADIRSFNMDIYLKHKKLTEAELENGRIYGVLRQGSYYSVIYDHNNSMVLMHNDNLNDFILKDTPKKLRKLKNMETSLRTQARQLERYVTLDEDPIIRKYILIAKQDNITNEQRKDALTNATYRIQEIKDKLEKIYETLKNVLITEAARKFIERKVKERDSDMMRSNLDENFKDDLNRIDEEISKDFKENIFDPSAFGDKQKRQTKEGIITEIYGYQGDYLISSNPFDDERKYNNMFSKIKRSIPLSSPNLTGMAKKLQRSDGSRNLLSNLTSGISVSDYTKKTVDVIKQFPILSRLDEVTKNQYGEELKRDNPDYKDILKNVLQKISDKSLKDIKTIFKGIITDEQINNIRSKFINESNNKINSLYTVTSSILEEKSTKEYLNLLDEIIIKEIQKNLTLLDVTDNIRNIEDLSIDELKNKINEQYNNPIRILYDLEKNRSTINNLSPKVKYFVNNQISKRNNDIGNSIIRKLDAISNKRGEPSTQLRLILSVISDDVLDNPIVDKYAKSIFNKFYNLPVVKKDYAKMKLPEYKHSSLRELIKHSKLDDLRKTKIKDIFIQPVQNTSAQTKPRLSSLNPFKRKPTSVSSLDESGKQDNDIINPASQLITSSVYQQIDTSDDQKNSRTPEKIPEKNDDKWLENFRKEGEQFTKELDDLTNSNTSDFRNSIPETTQSISPEMRNSIPETTQSISPEIRNSIPETAVVDPQFNFIKPNIEYTINSSISENPVSSDNQKNSSTSENPTSPSNIKITFGPPSPFISKKPSDIKKVPESPRKKGFLDRFHDVANNFIK